jgi:hypothetical protein
MLFSGIIAGRNLNEINKLEFEDGFKFLFNLFDRNRMSTYKKSLEKAKRRYYIQEQEFFEMSIKNEFVEE